MIYGFTCVFVPIVTIILSCNTNQFHNRQGPSAGKILIVQAKFPQKVGVSLATTHGKVQNIKRSHILFINPLAKYKIS